VTYPNPLAASSSSVFNQNLRRQRRQRRQTEATLAASGERSGGQSRSRSRDVVVGRLRQPGPVWCLTLRRRAAYASRWAGLTTPEPRPLAGLCSLTLRLPRGPRFARPSRGRSATDGPLTRDLWFKGQGFPAPPPTARSWQGASRGGGSYTSRRSRSRETQRERRERRGTTTHREPPGTCPSQAP